MILVAVTGPVGSGKSKALAEVAKRLTDRGHVVTGFVQTGIERADNRQGAYRYDLTFLPEGETVEWATRNDIGKPRYQVSESAMDRVKAWGRALAETKPEIVILDEFGNMEVEGEGHRHAWDKVIAAEPLAIVVGVRASCIDSLAESLGIVWDLVVDARDRRIVDQLVSLCDHSRDWEQVGLYGAASGAVEVSLGTALHSATVPGAGIIMSSLQAVVMTAAAEGLARKHRVAWVALVSAGLKALSPAGSRLRPMMAISVQGVLFASALRLFRWGPFAVAIGGALVGAWASAQSVLLQWLLVGSDMGRAYDIIVKWIASKLGLGQVSFLTAMAIFVLCASIATSAVSVVFWRSRNKVIHRLHTASDRIGSLRRKASRKRQSSELLRPSFWLPVAIIGTVLLANGSSWEHVVWIVLRSLAVGLVLFGCIKLVPVRKLPLWLQRIGLLGPAAAVGRAMRKP